MSIMYSVNFLYERVGIVLSDEVLTYVCYIIIAAFVMYLVVVGLLPVIVKSKREAIENAVVDSSLRLQQLYYLNKKYKKLGMLTKPFCITLDDRSYTNMRDVKNYEMVEVLTRKVHYESNLIRGYYAKLRQHIRLFDEYNKTLDATSMPAYMTRAKYKKLDKAIRRKVGSYGRYKRTERRLFSEDRYVDVFPTSRFMFIVKYVPQNGHKTSFSKEYMIVEDFMSIYEEYNKLNYA